MAPRKTTARPRARRATRTARRPARPAAPDSQLRQVWLAGLGAIASTGETANGIVDGLVARGRKREPQTLAAAERAVRDARKLAGELATAASDRSMKLFDDAIDRLGVRKQPRSRNILHRLGDVAEALL